MNIYVAHMLAKMLGAANSVGVGRVVLDRLSPKRPINHDTMRDRISKGMANFRDLFAFKEAGYKPNDATMLEFGTGAQGLDIYTAYILGYKKVITLDINNHLNIEWAKAADIYLEFQSEFADVFGVSEDELKEKVSVIKRANSVDELLESIHCEFMLFKDLKPGFAGSDGIDLWYSESNLMRIPLRQIMPLCKTVADEMNENALAFHRLDTRDVHQIPTYPFYAKNRHQLEYLKHSDLVWKLLNSDAYSSQNRLRVAQFDQMFNGFGQRLMKAEYIIRPGDLEFMQTLKVSDSYSYMTPEQLSIAFARVFYTNSKAWQGVPDISVFPENFPNPRIK